MTTEIVGIKEFRQNITSLWKAAQKGNKRYIVMNHAIPIFDVKPIKANHLILDDLAAEIKTARAQVKKGQIYSHEDAIKALGL